MAYLNEFALVVWIGSVLAFFLLGRSLLVFFLFILVCILVNRLHEVIKWSVWKKER